MNLHISHDNVFMDYIIPIARDVDPGNNKFVIFSYDNSPAPKLVKSKDVDFSKYNSLKFYQDIGDINQYKNIYVHWLEGLSADFVNRLPENKNVVWCFWGGDGLEIPALKKRIYQDKSLRYYKKQIPSNFGSIQSFKDYLRLRKRNELHLKAIRRTNYFAHYLEEDYALIKTATGMTSKFIPFHYAAVEDIVPKNNQERKARGNDILLGNSDTLSNNHFEAIDHLASLKLSGVRIYCPLSYEDGPYAKDVAEYGWKMLGDDFVPLTKMLPKDDYDLMLSGVNVAIMNHNRSQALGNIIVLLWKGAKLFMSGKSPVYHLLKNHGAAIYKLDDLNQAGVFSRLGDSDVVNNQSVLLKLFSKKNQVQKIKELLSL